MKSILIVNLPKFNVTSPAAAVAVLGGIAKEHNYKPFDADFNIYLWKNLNHDEWQELYNWSLLLVMSTELKEKILMLWDKMIDKKMPKNCAYLCISLFSYESLLISRLILEREKKKTNKYKIIVGGSGTSSSFADTNIPFIDWNNKSSCADYVVTGDGESAFASILTDGKKSYNMDNLDEIPLPDYSDIDYTDYEERKIFITGSRGCVRKCTFCNIASAWPKFKYRSPESIVAEIKKSFYDTGITTFEFTDSLINGSSSNFYKFNSLLAEEKEKHPDLKNITYKGQSICKTRKSMPEKHFEAMYYAGCDRLDVGIESFSEPIRTDMRKKFTNEDISYYLEQCGRWGISNIFLMLVGYPTETEKNHEENCKGLYTYQKYAHTGIIELIRFGNTMKLLEDTPIVKPELFNELGLYYDKDYEKTNFTSYWKSKLNPTNTLETRIRRRVELHKLCVKLNYPQPNTKVELTEAKELAKTIKNTTKISITNM
jgi:radical SAM superfamily enzyme YgiQ (UPF0313 family)